MLEILILHEVSAPSVGIKNQVGHRLEEGERQKSMEEGWGGGKVGQYEAWVGSSYAPLISTVTHQPTFIVDTMAQRPETDNEADTDGEW